jgi:hypothetical protein
MSPLSGFLVFVFGPLILVRATAAAAAAKKILLSRCRHARSCAPTCCGIELNCVVTKREERKRTDLQNENRETGERGNFIQIPLISIVSQLYGSLTRSILLLGNFCLHLKRAAAFISRLAESETTI